MQGNLRSINLQHSFEVETLDREKLAVGECILDHRGSSVRVLNGRIRRVVHESKPYALEIRYFGAFP
jgi:hypothetical protein